MGSSARSVASISPMCDSSHCCNFDPHLGFDRRDAPARAHSADQIQPVRTTLLKQRAIALNERLGLERQEEVGRRVAQRVAVETRRRDAHNGEGLVIQGEGAANHRRIECELLLPHAIAHDCGGRSAGLVIGRGQRAPGIGAHAEHGEVVAGHKLSRVRLRRIRAMRAPHPEQGPAGLKRGQLFEALGVVAKVLVELVRDNGEFVTLAVSAPDTAMGFLAEAIQLRGVRHWQRFEQNGIHQRENRCGRSDAQGQREGSGDGECRSLAQAPQRIARIVPKMFQE